MIIGVQVTEDHYESAWRNSVWDLTLTTEHGLHGNIYSSLLGLKTQSLETVSCYVLFISFIFLTMKRHQVIG